MDILYLTVFLFSSNFYRVMENPFLLILPMISRQGLGPKRAETIFRYPDSDPANPYIKGHIMMPLEEMI